MCPRNERAEALRPLCVTSGGVAAKKRSGDAVRKLMHRRARRVTAPPPIKKTPSVNSERSPSGLFRRLIDNNDRHGKQKGIREFIKVTVTSHTRQIV